MRKLGIEVETWRMREPLHVTGYIFDQLEFLVVNLAVGDHVGRGEAAGVYYAGETAQSMAAQIELVRDRLEHGIGRADLRGLLPAGGARNALDCALWELESRLAGTPVWHLAGLSKPKPLLTTFTLGGGEPEELAHRATNQLAQARAIKLKLLGDGHDSARVRSVRAARDDVWLGVDANQGLDRASLLDLIPVLQDARVALLEQPFKLGEEQLLDDIDVPIAVAADESALCLMDLPTLRGRFDVVNIKLDKCGGLTEALEMVRRARELGLGVMVGAMPGTSLALAPAMLVGQLCDVVDLDAPLFLAQDREPAARYHNGLVDWPTDMWGWTA